MPHTDRAANLLGATALAVGDLLREATERGAAHGATAPAALVSLANYPGQTIDELRRVVGLSHSGAVRLVDRLAADGLVARRPATDARAVALELTPAGRQAARRALGERQAAIVALLAADEERDRLVGALEKLLARLTSDEASKRRLCRLCDEAACLEDASCPVDQAGR